MRNLKKKVVKILGLEKRDERLNAKLDVLIIKNSTSS